MDTACLELGKAETPAIEAAAAATEDAVHVAVSDELAKKAEHILNDTVVAVVAPSSHSRHSHGGAPHSHSHAHAHSHSHSHGMHSHTHCYKSSREKAHHDHHKMHEKEINDVKLIAWMVLMGDGLHNFADGLAIGASFASDLTTGFGTAIAVLCHELPHEIGDFAVLRRAGVSLKRALVFNTVSGMLCLLGVFVGLMIGSFRFLTDWAFLFIAGTFLYISLVDMVSLPFLLFFLVYSFICVLSAITILSIRTTHEFADTRIV